MEDRELQVNISKVANTIEQTFLTGGTHTFFETQALDTNIIILRETIVKALSESYQSTVQSSKRYRGCWNTSTAVEIFWNNLDVGLLLNLLWAFHTKSDFGSKHDDDSNK